MSDQQVSNLNVLAQDVLTTPEALKETIPLTEAAERCVIEGRHTIQNILDGKDHRLLVVVGPCSIHDVDAALDYARRLRKLADQVSDSLFIVMRVYFEKPRTTVGWKGLINDPHLNDSFEIDEGLHIARKLLVDLAELGLPLATEALDPISPSICKTALAGLRSVHAPPNRKPIVKWHQDSPAQSASKTAPTAASTSLLMPCSLLPARIISWVSTTQVKLPLSVHGVTLTATSYYAVVMASQITIASALHWQKKSLKKLIFQPTL